MFLPYNVTVTPRNAAGCGLPISIHCFTQEGGKSAITPSSYLTLPSLLSLHPLLPPFTSPSPPSSHLTLPSLTLPSLLSPHPALPPLTSPSPPSSHLTLPSLLSPHPPLPHPPLPPLTSTPSSHLPSLLSAYCESCKCGCDSFRGGPQ